MTQAPLRLIKRNPAIIFFTFSLILLAEYLVLRREGRTHDADTIGKYVGITLAIGCLTHLSTSLLRAKKETGECRIVLRIPVYVAREYFTIDRVRAYVAENPGAPFILGFQFLLIVYALLLVKGAKVMANNLAVYAYYALVVGVLLQIFSYAREERKAS